MGQGGDVTLIRGEGGRWGAHQGKTAGLSLSWDPRRWLQGHLQGCVDSWTL